MLPSELTGDLISRLNSIKVQIEAITRMLNEGKDPDQISTQFKAADRALPKAHFLLLDEVFRKSLALNWERKSAWSNEYTDNKGRIWRFKQVIAIRGIYPDGRGYVRGTIKARRKVGTKWKRKRAYLWMQMAGTIWTNECIQPTAINSGVFQTNRARNNYRKKYAPVGSRFFRTKKTKLSAGFQLGPTGVSNWFGENPTLTW